MDTPDPLIPNLPEKNKAWLRKYLTDDQIGEFFHYSPSMDRHVYVHHGVDGIYWEARVVDDPNRPKVISKGLKPYSIWGKWKETSTVCLVEDIVSAIKLSDYVGVICLHGSIIPHHLYQKLGNTPGIKRVLIWLDRDKLSNAAAYEKKFEFWGTSCSVIMTARDPKDHSPEEIVQILKDAI
jgi:hypothetical protein